MLLQVFDGPVDPAWIENLNSTLDDTRTLTLANAQRLKLLKGTRLIFECEDVAFSSPATISRMGMTHVANSQATALDAWWRTAGKLCCKANPRNPLG